MPEHPSFVSVGKKKSHCNRSWAAWGVCAWKVSLKHLDVLHSISRKSVFGGIQVNSCSFQTAEAPGNGMFLGGCDIFWEWSLEALDIGRARVRGKRRWEDSRMWGSGKGHLVLTCSSDLLFTKVPKNKGPENVMLSSGDGHRCGSHQDQVGYSTGSLGHEAGPGRHGNGLHSLP